MPFGPVFWPSYALSLLKAELREAGFASRITIPFAERIGQAFYSDLAGGEKPSTSELAGRYFRDKAAQYWPGRRRRSNAVGVVRV